MVFNLSELYMLWIIHKLSLFCTSLFKSLRRLEIRLAEVNDTEQIVNYMLAVFTALIEGRFSNESPHAWLP